MKMNFFCKLKDFVIDLLFPDKCIFCDDVIPVGYEKWICPQCAEFAHISTENDKGVLYLYRYDGYVRDMLHRFKYCNNPQYAEKLGELLAERIRLENINDAHMIIPVPMHKKKKAKRGYNQAELLAEKMGKVLGIQVNDNVLARSQYTKAQSLVKKVEKEENVRNVFKVIDKNVINGKNIIITDDIYTSGSTMKACTKELKKAGAVKIYPIVVALAGHKM